MKSAFHMQRLVSWSLAVLLAIGIAGTATAEPPPWARHHGWSGHRAYEDNYVYGGYYRQPVVVAVGPPVVIQEQSYVTPTQGPVTLTGPAFTNDAGQYCREYTSTVRVGGEVHDSYGTACQKPDGQWRVLN